MTPDMSAGRAPAGDVTAAILEIDSMLKRINGTATSTPPDLSGSLIATPADAAGLLDGFCTLLYLFITAFRKACEASGKDVLAETVPFVVGTLRAMTKGVAPKAVPVMAAMMTAAAMGLSPSLWRAGYGPWRPAELTALERTLLILAQEINTASGTDDAALRMVMDTLAAADGDTPL